MDAGLYLQAFVTTAGAIMGIWGFFKVIGDIKSKNDKEVSWRRNVDEVVKIVNEKSLKWDKGLEDVFEERGQIVERYDARLDEQDAKIQQLYTMMIMFMRSQNVILEALIEAGIGNGDVKAMHKELNSFITEQIGK